MATVKWPRPQLLGLSSSARFRSQRASSHHEQHHGAPQAPRSPLARAARCSEARSSRGSCVLPRAADPRSSSSSRSNTSHTCARSLQAVGRGRGVGRVSNPRRRVGGWRRGVLRNQECVSGGWLKLTPQPSIPAPQASPSCHKAEFPWP